MSEMLLEAIQLQYVQLPEQVADYYLVVLQYQP
jgi:hypothetical protein